MRGRVRIINDIGAGMAGDSVEKMTDFCVFEEEGHIIIRVEMQGGECIQYLTPSEAMQFSAAFKRCAIAALENEARVP